jgi:alcohol dehydrogenase (cytochrome c)
MDWQGRPRSMMLWANRNGFYYALDRATGQFLLGKPFVKVTWASGLDEKGRPLKIAGMVPTAGGTVVYPGVQGGTNFYSPSYSPRTQLFYIPAWVNYSTNYTKFPIQYEAGQRYTGGTPRNTQGGGGRGQVYTPGDDDGYSAVRAIDPQTGSQKWEFKMSGVTLSGLLTTGSDLLFTGSRDGYFFALDARSGAMLWKSTVGGPTAASPIAYEIAGKQFIAIASGSSVFAFALH